MKNKKLWTSIIAALLAFLMLFGIFASLIPTASAASSSEIKKQIQELKKQRTELQGQIDSLQDQKSDTVSEIEEIQEQKSLIEQQVSILYEQVELINQEIAAFNVLIADKQDELDQAEAKLEELSEQNRERIRTMEEDGTLSYWSVLFQANSFSDLLDRLSMIEEIAAADQQRLKELSAAADAVSQAKDALAAERTEMEASKTELNAAQAELDAKSAEADEILAQLIAKNEELEILLEDHECEDEDLLAEIAAKEKEYNEAKKAEQATATKPSTGSNGGSTGSSNATWIKPCTYRRVSSPFGKRESPTAGASTYHQGIDLAAPKGTPIYASRSGTVTSATYSKSAGNHVVINHGDGYSSIYMHMTNYVVKAGQTVSQGQLIGYVGSTGYSTGPHLHFGISYNGTYVNPANYINF